MWMEVMGDNSCKGCNVFRHLEDERGYVSLCSIYCCTIRGWVVQWAVLYKVITMLRYYYITRTADVSAVAVADAPLILPIATVKKYLAANQMPSELQIFKTNDRKSERHSEMKTYPDYTDILLHNGHFLSQIFKVEASTIGWLWYVAP